MSYSTPLINPPPSHCKGETSHILICSYKNMVEETSPMLFDSHLSRLIMSLMTFLLVRGVLVGLQHKKTCHSLTCKHMAPRIWSRLVFEVSKFVKIFGWSSSKVPKLSVNGPFLKFAGQRPERSLRSRGCFLKKYNPDTLWSSWAQS